MAWSVKPMDNIMITTPEELGYSRSEIAGTEPRTPDGYVPGGVAGYLVDECTVLCAECGRNHPDVKSHVEDTDIYDYSYSYIGCSSETDYGDTCEDCGKVLDTNILVYEGSPEYRLLRLKRESPVKLNSPNGESVMVEVWGLDLKRESVKVDLLDDFDGDNQGDTLEIENTSWLVV